MMNQRNLIQILRPQSQHLRLFATSKDNDWVNALRHHTHYNMKGGTFGNTLGLCVDALPHSQISPHEDINGRSALKLRYKFPSRVASPHYVDGMVDLSTILSVFDEVSSWNLFAGDKTRRPGVSVHLSADAHWDASDPPLVGQDYEITTTISSSGRQLGFLSLEMRRCSDKSLVASGKHIKFLPMPGIGPKKILPWDKVFGSKLAAPFLLSSMEKLVVSHSVSSDHLNDNEPKFKQWLAQIETSQIDDKGSAQLKLKSSREHCNVMGTIHGGFQAVLAEACARSDARVARGSNLVSISTEYVSACRPGGFLKAISNAAPNTAGQQVVRVSIADDTTGKVSSNSTLLFHHQPK